MDQHFEQVLYTLIRHHPLKVAEVLEGFGPEFADLCAELREYAKEKEGKTG